MSRNREARAPADCAQLLVMSKKRVPKGTLSLTGKLHSFWHPSTIFQQNQKERITANGARQAPFTNG
jgi:hypothetical protein